MATITFRTDSVIEQALAELMANGSDRSTAIRDAILTARKEMRRAQLRAECEAIRNDPDDLAEVRAIQQEMETLRAW